jgi:ribonuclease R
VVAQLFYPEDTGEDEVYGEIAEVLGKSDSPEVETAAVMLKYDLKSDFPELALQQAQAIPVLIPESALEGRLDLRERRIFTVDGRDAKDFDDAIHIEALDEGGFQVGIHIADVSHYVVEGSPLDQDAYARATSVYLPGHVIPMLPEHLSNGVCSLVPGQDRLTLSVLAQLNGEGELVSYQIAPTAKPAPPCPNMPVTSRATYTFC